MNTDQERAEKVLAEIDILREELRDKSLALAVLLYEVWTEKHYKIRGYKTWRSYVRGEFKIGFSWAYAMAGMVKKAKKLGLYQEMIDSGLKVKRLERILFAVNTKDRAMQLMKRSMGKKPLEYKFIEMERAGMARYTMQLSPKTWNRLNMLKKELETSMDITLCELLDLYEDFKTKKIFSEAI